MLQVLFMTMVLVAVYGQAGKDAYTDEDRPYEFGFNIDGYQHRHEKKDEKGIITGEFGFITADGIYHVTVYATDENGDFKILSMKNIKVGFPPGTGLKPTTPKSAPPPILAQTAKPPSGPGPVEPGPAGPSKSSAGLGIFSISTTTSTTPKVVVNPGCGSCKVPVPVTQKPSTFAPAGQPSPPANKFGSIPPVNKFGSIPPGGQSLPPGGTEPPAGGIFGTQSPPSGSFGGRPATPGSNTGTQYSPGGGFTSKPFTGSNFQSHSPPGGTFTTGGNNFGNQQPPDGTFASQPFPGSNTDSKPPQGNQFGGPGNQFGGQSPPFGNNIGTQQPPASSFGPQYSPGSNGQNPSSGTGAGFQSPPGSGFGTQKPPGSAFVSKPPTGSPFGTPPPGISSAVTQRPPGSIYDTQNPPISNIVGGKSPSQGGGIGGQPPFSTAPKLPGGGEVPLGVERPGLPKGITESDVMNLLYRFNYTVGFHGHHEEGYRNGDKIGGYYANGRDGISVQANYIANEFGYQPNITFVPLGLDSPDTPKEETEKNYGLKGYAFEWFYKR